MVGVAKKKGAEPIEAISQRESSEQTWEQTRETLKSWEHVSQHKGTLE